jgi:hypothetical protein
MGASGVVLFPSPDDLMLIFSQGYGRGKARPRPGFDLPFYAQAKLAMWNSKKLPAG